MSAGMAYEALNNAGALDARLIVILNDNDMSIAPPTGAMSAYLARLASGRTYMGIREVGKKLTAYLGKTVDRAITRAVEHARGYVTGGTLFEEMGFYHIGPIDGHSFEHLLPVLRNVRDNAKGPVLIHVVTQKGKGYPPAEAAADKYHGVNKFDVITGAQAKAKPNAPAYTSVFAEALTQEAGFDDKIVAITAAMPSGTGPRQVRARPIPTRCFDVGIAEQHAVTFAAGLASEGYKPFAALYSTFLQRGYDQVVHDVAIQGLPVRFPIDRAGFVGADGPTHAGSFDTTYLATLPGFVVMAAADEAELKHMVRTAAAYDAGPISFRYPRGEGVGVEMPERGEILEIGKGRVVKQGTKVALLSFGTRLADCLLAAEDLDAAGLSTTVADARFAKPLDHDLIRQLARHHEVLDHHRGRRSRRFCQPRAAVPRRRRPARRRPEGAPDGDARHLDGAGKARGDVCPWPASTAPASFLRCSRHSARSRISASALPAKATRSKAVRNTKAPAMNRGFSLSWCVVATIRIPANRPAPPPHCRKTRGGRHSPSVSVQMAPP